jgi:FMN reductase
MTTKDYGDGQARSPLIVGIGGTPRPGSSTELALRAALRAAERHGARTRIFGGEAIGALPLYNPGSSARNRSALELVSALRESAGVVLASPGYHGTLSGAMKNAIDYAEDIRDASPPYLSGRPVGCIGVAAGWQGAVNALNSLRGVTHALRGWPTPLGLTINSLETRYDVTGDCLDPQLNERFELLAHQLMRAVHLFRHGERSWDPLASAADSVS